WPRLGDYASFVDQEVVRVPMKAVTPPQPMDRFLIGLAPFSAAGASSVTFTWGDRSFTVPVRDAAAASTSQPAARPSPLARAPRETVKGTVGGKAVSIEYGRPMLRDRNLGQLLGKLPADRIWRA